MAGTNADVVRALFAAFTDQDAAAADSLLADEFVFTSPQDDRIDKATWLRVCFPTADHFVSRDMIAVMEMSATDVLAYYEYEVESGERYRNTEVISVLGGRVVETQVFFGGRQG